MSKLAINGGKSIRTVTWPKWPVVGKTEIELMNKVVSSGVWSYNGPKEKKFARKFADYIGTKYVVCAANVTVTPQIALEALGIGYGDEDQGIDEICLGDLKDSWYGVTNLNKKVGFGIRWDNNTI